MNQTKQQRQWTEREAWMDQPTQDTNVRNTSGLTPLGHAVIVEPYEPEVKKSLLELPKEAAGRMSMLEQRAIVIAVGPLAWSNEPEARAKPGDKVLVAKYEGYTVGTDRSLDGKLYRVVNDMAIFCRFEERPT